MKVLDLQCGAGHGFEGWFASEADYEQQRSDGRLECPLCGDAHVVRLPSAPRLNLSGARAPEAPAHAPASASGAGPAAGASGGDPASIAHQLAARWQQAVAQLVRDTEDVGDRFPEEARRIHYGEAPPKGIRGQATPEQRAALHEEGIETVAIPVPVVPKRSLQ